MTGRTERAQRALQRWKSLQDSRDKLIIDALDSGLSKMEIHNITGISRSHIDEVIRREQNQWQQHQPQPQTAGS